MLVLGFGSLDICCLKCIHLIQLIQLILVPKVPHFEMSKSVACSECATQMAMCWQTVFHECRRLSLSMSDSTTNVSKR